MLLTKCWAPCFTLNKANEINLERGSILIALYTAVLHILSLFYGIALLNNSVRTDTFFSPVFELSKSSTRMVAIFLILYSLAFVICCSFGLIFGVRNETRFFYLPWMYCTAVELLFATSFGIFMVYRYWHYAWATFSALILWFYSGYHAYLFWTVVSLYCYLKELQEPTFIILYA